MFDRCSGGPMGGDMTCIYSVFLRGEYTVGKFINEMLQKYGNEWGSIEIRPSNNPYRKLGWYGYESGKLTSSSLTSDYLDKKVTRASANGGWGNMDYILWIND